MPPLTKLTCDHFLYNITIFIKLSTKSATFNFGIVFGFVNCQLESGLS